MTCTSLEFREAPVPAEAEEVAAPAAPAETAATPEVPPVSLEEPVPAGPTVVDTSGLAGAVPVPLAVPAEEAAAVPIAT